MASTVQSRKAKGRRLQQHVRDLILETYNDLEPDDVRSTPMGCSGEDVWLSPKARKEFPYSVECKNVERLNIWKTIEQCESNLKDGSEPLIVFSKNRAPKDACIKLDHFMELIKNKKE
jgi:hypothetical protein